MKPELLYVDDEVGNLVVFEAAFEDDFQITLAQSAEEVLELMEERAFAVVVADHRMPRMTGVELLEILRERHPLTKRILLTGYTDPAAMIDSINRGQVFHYVRKPWERHELLAILRRAFEAHDLEIANQTLTNQLIAADRLATLGQATARIAHEMGNQLCMLPLLEVMQGEFAGNPRMQKIAGFATQTYERLVALVEEVKKFVRQEHEEFDRRPLALDELIQELVSFLRFDRKIDVTRVHAQLRDAPPVLGNRFKLQQVLTNLIKNASDAIDGREDGWIRISLQQDGDRVRIDVSDNGCGIPESIAERVWQPFFTTKGANGNGLGLDVCRRLVESHGGSIACDSVCGAGTTFSISLPAADSASAAAYSRTSTGLKAALPVISRPEQ
ncbi:sensor histidine kinase [Planctellipticum variicoloris]|uniref:sensor histidine kinase n=1 Tax=Planctellipticum variicoloris TaxID=3064265 RepID=UPI0030139C53|nr:ATP-binding protein [Planctomycetaceae bacterium SH412]